MLISETPRRNSYQFDDLPDMVDYLRHKPRVWRYNSSKTEGSYEKSWTLGVDYDGALQLAKTGWEAGVRQLHALATTIPNKMVRTRELSVAGDYADVPRFLAGDPFNMIKRGKSRVPKPSMTIVSSYGGNCNISGQEMANYGAAIVALVDRLEARGVRVELVACSRITNMADNSSLCISWTLKRPEDHLDLSAIAFGLGHPAMFRRLVFAVIERSPKHCETMTYGVSSEVIGKVDLLDVPDNALYIGGIGGRKECATIHSAIEYAKANINRAYRAMGYDDDVAELEELD